MFFLKAAHFYPFIDEATFKPYESSITVHNAIFLAGAQIIATSSDDPASVSGSPRLYYNRAKTLFHLHAERDPISILQALCLMTWWSRVTSEIITLDTAWHWTGVGLK